MIVLGAILLILGLVFGIIILTYIGVILWSSARCSGSWDPPGAPVGGRRLVLTL